MPGPSTPPVIVLPRPFVVAIDGPSGSGKSSVSREAARRLGLAYLDTGAMYRAATWSCLDAGLDLDDQAAVEAHTLALDLHLDVDPTSPSVRVGVRDISADIRDTRVTTVVSKVATNLGVRAELLRRQRALIAESSAGEWGGVVAEGRDITTVVAPDADARLLLTASEEARLARRARQVHGEVDLVTVAATRDQVLRRDADDATVSTFHTAADGVVELDSSSLDFDETVEAVLRVVAAAASLRIQPAGAVRP